MSFKLSLLFIAIQVFITIFPTQAQHKMDVIEPDGGKSSFNVSTINKLIFTKDDIYIFI